MTVIPETRMNEDVKCFLIGDIHYFDGKEKKREEAQGERRESLLEF